MELRGAVSIVTGGNGGLGRRICAALARAGSDVAVVCRRSREDAEGVAAELRELGVRAEVFLADVTSRPDIENLYQHVLGSFGRIDVLVNNAAYNQWVPFKDIEGLTPEIWETILHTNATGPFLASRAVAPIMKRQGGGRIVNISSVAGFSPTGSSIAYAVSKAAVIHLTKCLAVALSPEIRVNTVAPGLVLTRWGAKFSEERIRQSIETVPLHRTVEPDEIAEATVACVRNEAMTGQLVAVDAGSLLI